MADEKPVGKHLELDPTMPILLVSNNNDVRFYSSKTLKQAGFKNLTETISGIEALGLAAKQKFSLVICDIEVKFIPGWQFIKEVKNSEKIPNLPCLFVGNADCPVKEEDLKEYGVVAYLKHPFDLKMMMETLTKSIEGSKIEAAYTEAKQAVLDQKPKEAIPKFEALRQETKDSNRSIIGLAHAFEADAQPVKAAETIQQVKGDELSALTLQMEVAFQNKDLPKAKEIFEKIVKVSENSPFYFLRCAEVAFENAGLELCLEICERATKLEIDFSDFMLFRAKVRYQMGNANEAIKDLARMEKRHGVSLGLLNLRGICYRKLEKFKEATECYVKAIEIAPRDARLHFNHAICLHAMGAKEEAVKALETCLTYAPNFSKAQEKLRDLKAA